MGNDDDRPRRSDPSVELEPQPFPQFQTVADCERRIAIDGWLLEFLEHCEPSDWHDRKRIEAETRRNVLAERVAGWVING